MPSDGNHTRLRKTTKSPGTIGFRLDAEAHRALAGRAARLGLSPHALAKLYVMDMLQQDENRADLADGLRVCIKMLDRLRQNVLSTAILVASGRCTEKEARAWVEENFE